MPVDPFGRALRDFHRGDMAEPLVRRDGDETEDHPVEAFYFEAFDPDSEDGSWLDAHLDGPLLDVGAGVGRHARHYQDEFETVAVEVSGALVETMRERGVRDARRGDLFDLRASFDRDRFRSVLVVGTQLGLVGSTRGLRKCLGDTARVTTPNATAVVDCYDPDRDGVEALLGYRADPTPGLAHRVFHFEYEGEVGPTLLFRLFSPARLREAAVGTGWVVDAVRRSPAGPYYRAALAKR